MSTPAEITFKWAWHLIGSLAAAGVRQAIISPGSRSTPLALAALRHPHLCTHVVVDERSAAFFALGIAKASGMPPAVIATSGSAPANWFPAVAEADMARVPMLLLSADRPPELQNCGANQTMDQLALFGSHVRGFHQLPPAEEGREWLNYLAGRAVAESLWPLPGPVHINVPLREPLVMPGNLTPAPASMPPQELASSMLPAPATVDLLVQIVSGECGAIICGPEDSGGRFSLAVTQLAHKLAAPVFADVLSGVRFGPEATGPVLAHPDQVARNSPEPQWVLRFGGTPVSRATNAWLERCRGSHQIVVASHPRTADPSGTATHVLRACSAEVCEVLRQAEPAPPAWLDNFLMRDGAAAAAAAMACAGSLPFEGALIRALFEALPANTPVFLGNSLSVRAADWFAGRSKKHLRLFGNRGVSGIDGNLSTAFGITAALGRAVAVTGDLAFLHDLNALAIGRKLPLKVLLLDNGGGGIFDHLPQTVLPEFERGWLTTQQFDPLLAAKTFSLATSRATRVEEAIAKVLSHLDEPCAAVVHVPIDRKLSLARCTAFFTSWGSMTL